MPHQNRVIFWPLTGYIVVLPRELHAKGVISAQVLGYARRTARWDILRDLRLDDRLAVGPTT